MNPFVSVINAGDPVAVAERGAWEYGVLGIVCLIFGYAIITLYKRGEAKTEAAAADRAAQSKSMDTERTAWATEREEWATEREKIRADLSEKFARDLREVIQQYRENETTIRRENADMLETMASEGKRASDAMVTMLQKLQDRALSKSGR